MTDAKQTRDPTRIVTLDDTQHVAYLKLKGWKVTAWMEAVPVANQDPNAKRVEFRVEGDPDEIEMDMKQFYGNISIPILDFCRCLKEVKSAMYNLRRLKSLEHRTAPLSRKKG